MNWPAWCSPWDCNGREVFPDLIRTLHPPKVEASGPPVHPQTTPKEMATRFEFPADDQRPAVTLHWYHADTGPEVLRQHQLPDSSNNTLFIGSQGMAGRARADRVEKANRRGRAVAGISPGAPRGQSR